MIKQDYKKKNYLWEVKRTTLSNTWRDNRGLSQSEEPIINKDITWKKGEQCLSTLLVYRERKKPHSGIMVWSCSSYINISKTFKRPNSKSLEECLTCWPGDQNSKDKTVLFSWAKDDCITPKWANEESHKWARLSHPYQMKIKCFIFISH